MSKTDYDRLWRRIRYTPLFEMVVGRPTGRLDLEAVIARGALPEDLAAIVRETVRKTRLHRWQKAEVTRDLVEHFREGLEGGDTSQHLHSAFGDTSAAAALIRRSMMRKQSWAIRQSRLVLKVGLVFLAFMIVIYLGVAVNDWRQRPNVVTDHIAGMNAPILATGMDRRAWPLVRDGLLSARSRMSFDSEANPEVDEGVARDRRLSELLTVAQAELGDWQGAEPVGPFAPEDRMDAGTVDEFFARVDPIRTMLLEASRRPILGFEVEPGEATDSRDRELFHLVEPLVAAEDVPVTSTNLLDGSLITLSLPHLSSLRLATRLLDADARRAVLAGRGARAVEDLAGMLRLAAQVRTPPFLISQLVGMAIDQMVFKTLIDGLAAHPESFDDDDLQGIIAMLAALDDRRFMTDLSFERLAFDDLSQRIYTDDGDGDGRLVLGAVQALNGNIGGGGPVTGDAESGVFQFLLSPMLSRLTLSRAEATAIWDELFDQYELAAARPAWEIDRGSLGTIRGRPLAEFGSNPIEGVRLFPLPLLMPALDQAIIVGTILRIERDLALAVAGLEASRRRSGEWPATLEDAGLVLSPRDPMDGSTLRYRVVDGTPTLWSIGPDRDDDGGVGIVPVSTTSLRWGPAQERAGMRGLVSHLGAGTPAESQLDGDLVVWRGPGPGVSPDGSGEGAD
ncbi:MAG: hypothetical protein GY895_14495 [Phycisphaera sp.]|nr:hypothetical protein [Phycisphaera sp.]